MDVGTRRRLHARQSVHQRVHAYTCLQVHVIFGKPVDLSRYLSLRSTPPFDRHPELLFEVIAHTLEEEVRGLRDELNRRLGRPAFSKPECGAFHVDSWTGDAHGGGSHARPRQTA